MTYNQQPKYTYISIYLGFNTWYHTSYLAFQTLSYILLYMYRSVLFRLFFCWRWDGLSFVHEVSAISSPVMTSWNTKNNINPQIECWRSVQGPIVFIYDNSFQCRTRIWHEKLFQTDPKLNASISTHVSHDKTVWFTT